MNAIDITDGLNDPQKEAVLYNDGPSLVIAGAGSGKTRVLTLKIAYLLSLGMDPWNILSLTFTNKSAREMKHRIAQVVGEEKARYLWMGTFHSIFARILRLEAEALKIPSTFSIYDTSDSKSLLRSIIKEMKLDDKVYKVSAVQHRISTAKNNLLTAEAYHNNKITLEQDGRSKMPLLRDIYVKYVNRCKQAGAMDFDDILLNTNLLFRDYPQVLKKYQERFKYVLVDEYQDTNISQAVIVSKLSAIHQRICVVGDDAQSIYSFRGARIENILNFKNSFPNYRLFKLEQNYRSTQNIVNAANSLIGKNETQIQKVAYSKRPDGDKVALNIAHSDIEEGFLVVNEMTELHYQHPHYDDYAILYRTNAQSRIFEEALRKRNVPYRIYGGLSFYQRKEIKDLISYFRLIVNHLDDEALKRIINFPARGIGATTVMKLETAAIAHGKSIWEVLTNPAPFQLNLNQGTWQKIKDFSILLNHFSTQQTSVSAYELAHAVATQTGILTSLHNDKSPEGVSSYENLEELLNGIQEFVQGRIEQGEDAFLANFMEEVALLTDQDKHTDEHDERVTLMTIHAAKGLEFKYVFVVGLEEELFPSARAIKSAKDIEEERRLFYVAITRAEERCFVSYSKTRMQYGKFANTKPSRFIRDIDPQYLLLSGEALEFKRREKEEFGRPVSNSFRGDHEKPSLCFSAADFVPDAPESIQIGMAVEHQRFGIGKVIHLHGEWPNRKARILFKHSDQKELLLKYARLKIVK